MKKLLIIAFVLFQVTAIAQIRFNIESTKVNQNNTGFTDYKLQTGYVEITNYSINMYFKDKYQIFNLVRDNGTENTDRGSYTYSTYIIDGTLVDMVLHVSVYGNVYLYMYQSDNYVVEFKLIK